jgi:hypothetical protein
MHINLGKKNLGRHFPYPLIIFRRQSKPIV